MWRIYVPTAFEDTKKPVSTRHHKQWDKVVRKIAGGLTIYKPAKGQWVHMGELYEDRVIPVEISCTRKQFIEIAEFTKRHYRQIAVMGYVLSSEVVVV